MSVRDLLDAVGNAFAITGRGLATWPDPHASRAPSDDEYSRVTDADKWRIVGARVDAWLNVLSDLDVARVERHASVQWTVEPVTPVSSTDRAVPGRPVALPLVVARTAIGDVAGTGVMLGVGDPATCIARVPACGCDACDSGSQNELDELDRIIVGVVAGTFRRLTAADREITQLDGSGWSASGDFRRLEVEHVLANPEGWQEISGEAWTDLN